MITIKIKKQDAENVRKLLAEKDLIVPGYKTTADNEHVYIAVNAKVKSVFPDFEIVEKELEKVEPKQNLIEMLKKHLSDDELDKFISSYDMIGNIVIIDIPDELSQKQNVIGECLLKVNPIIKTVFKKSGIHKGEFRTQKLELIAGENTKETIHKENSVRIKLNVEKVYYSPRSATERKRIAGLVKTNENVLVMFSGCGPFVLVISKNTEAKKVVGIELNPIAHEYAQENVILNKLDNVELQQGDVKEIVPKLGKFDRILMPLPKTSEDFLDIALNAADNGTIIHFYDFSKEEKFPEKSIEKIKTVCDKKKIQFKVLDSVKCGVYSPGVIRICIDFKIE